MTVLTIGVVGACAVTAGAAAPATAGFAAGIMESALVASGSGAGAAVAGAAGFGASAGAIAGAAGVAGTGVAAAATSAGTGALIGSGTAAAVTSSTAGTAGLVGSGLAAGPIGWIVLGCTLESVAATFDCWKPVLHDESRQPSVNGVLLKDVFVDHRIRDITVANETGNFGLPEIVLENIWEEKFRIDYLLLPTTNVLAAHAVRL